ncbi:MAG: hypothetical protein M0R66_03720 [Candidatus Omnitrophica bacterium]|nr:hypothetical protein [Candidatus Omnitrophota bacterium]
MRELVDTPANARALAQRLDTMFGLPLRGVHVGLGTHFTMSPTWNGALPVPVGWTTHLGGTVQQGLVVCDEQVVPDGDQRLDKLIGLERAEYVILLAKLRRLEEQLPEIPYS